MPVYHSQARTAQHYGVSDTAVRKWEKHPAWPCKPGEYDTEQIDRWRNLYLERQREHEPDKADQLAIGLKAVKLQREQLKLEHEKRAAERARGDTLSRAELETSFAEAITIARDQLLTIPHRIARLANSKREQRRLMNESQSVVCKVLEDLATMLDELQNPEGETA